MKALAVFFAALLGCAPILAQTSSASKTAVDADLLPPAPATRATTELQQKLQQMAAQYNGKVALFAQDLKTGQTVTLDPDHVVQTASIIKLPIFIEAFHQIRDGKLHFDDKIMFRPEDKVPGSGILQFLRAPQELPLEDALVLMMIESDNTATNLVIDKVGLKNVNDRIRQMGLNDTYLYKKVYKPAEGPMPADQKKYGLGKTTPRQMAAAIASIERCDLGAPELCKKMVAIMRGQQYRNMIPHYIEADTDTSEKPSAIIDKLGMLDAVRADVGIVYSAAGPIVISAFTYENQDQRWTFENAGELLIAHMAKEIVDAWSSAGVKTGEEIKGH